MLLLRIAEPQLYSSELFFHSGLVTKYNQISQNVDATAHCPITKGTLFFLHIQLHNHQKDLNPSL